MKLALVIGHTHDAKGAFGIAPLNEYEYDYNTGLAVQVFKNLADSEIDVKIFDKTGRGTAKTILDVNAWFEDDDDCRAIELHFNASVNGLAHGTETLYASKQSEIFAKSVHKAICTALKRSGKDDRGVKHLDTKDRGYNNIWGILNPAIIIEPGFGDNARDAFLLTAKFGDIADAISKSVIMVFTN